ncbi:MAG: prephenate dehydratase [Leptospiraceae bacterium]|nr:prephenate dehydratase [Leptospiraceae bacterium]MCP5499302.1 prephenate dehydratase [Leptospiraceae bacterium]
MNEDLLQYRNRIDELDKEIIDCIQERAKLAGKIGEVKRTRGEPIYRPDREREVYRKVKNLNKGPLSDSHLFAIYREIMSGAISIEKGLHVAFLGPKGSFSHQATVEKFGDSIEVEPVSSIPEIFRVVEAGKCDYGVVPVENSSEGLVNSTLDVFVYSDLKIYAETYMKISLHLLGFDKDLSKAKKLYGIKIANSQCKEWIARNLPHCEIVETSSTARAAQLVAERKDGLAIASTIAAELYGLEIIQRSIEDMPNNSTRFLIIGNAECEPTGKDKTSLYFSTSDRPGALFSILKPFYDNNINLTKIESRPTRKNSWEYNFFLDFEGHRKDPLISQLLLELEEKTTVLRVLGSYPSAESF